MSKPVPAPPNALVEFLTRYGPLAGEEGPPRFVQEILGGQPDEWQDAALRDFGRRERHISVASCHGTGKTTYDAWCIIYQLLCRYPQKSVATAPSVGQLEDALVSEVLMWFHRMQPQLQALYEVKKNRIELRAAPEDSFFSARTARAESPEAIQGVHSDWVLLVIDEASGVPEPIFEAGAGSMSGHNATTIMTSNPVRPSGFFFDSHNKMRGSWRRYEISGIPREGAYHSKRVSPDFASMVADTYGPDSDVYRVRVLGLFPSAEEDTIIPIDALVAAQERSIYLHPKARQVWALDVARFGKDSTTLLKRTGVALLPDIRAWHGLSLEQTYGRLKDEFMQADPRPLLILVDVIGYGASIVDFGLADGLPMRGVNVSETRSHKDRYKNKRAELYFKARDWVMDLTHSMPKCDGKCPDRRRCVHEQLIGEASSLKYKYATSGGILVESKDDYKARAKRGSPDLADAWAISFDEDVHGLVEPGEGALNLHMQVPWNQPIRRRRVRV